MYQKRSNKPLVSLLLSALIAGYANVSCGQEQVLSQSVKKYGWDITKEENGFIRFTPIKQNKGSIKTNQKGLISSNSQAAPMNKQQNKDKQRQQIFNIVEKMPADTLWQIKRSEGDGILLYPVLPNKNTNQNKEIAMQEQAINFKDSDGRVQIKGSDIELPIDSWEKAHQAAQYWLQQVENKAGNQGLLVGKIRKILRVYIISIVEDKKPFNLVYQVAVVGHNGDIIRLYR